MSCLHSTLRNLVSDDRGNVMITFGLTTMLAVAAVGGAIDFGRAYKEKDRMQAALDAALIGGMTTYRETNDWAAAQNRASAIFSAQFPDMILQNTDGTRSASAGVPVLTLNQSGDALSGSATMQTSTPFLKFVTGSDLTVGTTASADLSGESLTSSTRKKIEVGMMVDLTGSMGESRNGSTKISALKLAGADLLDILLPSSGANDAYVRIGIAPFADYVNAGSYASAVTGLAATGGSFTNISNLAWTKNGVFNGTYSGATGSSTGSQAGATPPTSGASAGGTGSTVGNGATYNNAYCSNPTTTSTTTVTNTKTTSQFGSADIGAPVNYGSAGSVNSPFYYQNNYGTWYYVSFAGYMNYSYGYGYSSRPYGYLYYQKNNGSWVRADNNTYYNSHIPNTTTQTVTSVVAGCESTEQTQASSKLISCVTERTDSTNRYTDAAPGSSAGYIGPYNAGRSNKDNYSTDGKCWVAGRELPAVIPITNSRSTLLNFFDTATIGGGTPGHLGTAWARYLISPNWSDIWPSDSTPVAYNDTSTLKAVILMTDGEYNMQYSGDSSITQAKAQCDAMKAQGVQIFSIGFGFSTSSQPGDGSIEGNAKAALRYCATDAAHYFVPYDGAALRTAFQSIGNALATQSTTSQVVQQAARVKN